MPAACFLRVLIFVLVAGAGLAHATEVARPRIGLVLGGGGARGAAHIGVLEVLEKLHVPVDCVAGTSMGALVSGAYAAGMTPATMRDSLAKADWNDMFVDDPEYSEMSYRNKVVSRHFMPGSESGVTADGVRYQPGVVSGQKIKLFFNQLVRANQGERNIENLPLPLSIIATDIATGERVVFREGPLSNAMRASMSVPGLLAPHDYNGRKLVDGGLVDNVPIGEARERCQADVVIAVNVGSPLLKPSEIGSLLTVSAQMVNILTEQNVSRSLTTLKPGDIYIKPDLEGLTAGDFSRTGEIADRGRAAAEAMAPQLARLAVDAPTYTAWWKGIEMANRVSPHIDAVEVVGLERVNPAMVERHLHVERGQTIRPDEINRDLLRMYGDGYYERVDYTVLTRHERNILRVMPVEKSWGPDYLRFAVNLNADNSQGSSFDLRLGYHKTWLNTLGGELLVTGDVGSTTRLGAILYQPIDARQRFFVEAKSGIERSRLNIYEDDQRIAQYLETGSLFGIAAGANIGLLGQLRLGWEEHKRRFDRDIGATSLPTVESRFGGWHAALDFDQFDRMYFPTRGWAAQLGYFDSARAGYARADADLSAAYALGGTVFNGRVSYSGSPHGQLPIFDAARLGGFLNLSAYAPNQILGDDIVYGGLRAERIVGSLPLGLRGDMRLGVAAEAAHVGTRYTEKQGKALLNSLSLYFGGQTPLGPVYLGFGYSTSKVSNLFLFLGTP